MRSAVVLAALVPLAAAADSTAVTVPMVAFSQISTIPWDATVWSADQATSTISLGCQLVDCGGATIVAGPSTYSATIDLNAPQISMNLDLDCPIKGRSATCNYQLEGKIGSSLIPQAEGATNIPNVANVPQMTLTAEVGSGKGPTAAPATSTDGFAQGTFSPKGNATDTGTATDSRKGGAKSTSSPDGAAPTQMAGLLGVAGVAAGVAAAML